jgi:TPR repeat protein
MREEEQGLEQKCPYCRETLPETDEEMDQNQMKRVKANDPVALRELGKRCRDESDYSGAFQNFSKAAELDDIEAHFELSVLYRKEQGVEKDEKKEIYHLEEASIGGHPKARYNLGCHEEDSGQINRAMKHYIIAAKLGLDRALEAVKKGFAHGIVSKEDFEAALRGHQAAVDATKSEQRDAAYEYYDNL